MPRSDLGRTSGRISRWLPVVLVLVILGAAAVSFELDLGRKLRIADEPAASPAEVPAPAGLDLPDLADPTPVGTPADLATPADPAAVRRAVQKILRTKALGKHVVAAVGSAEGETWFDNGAGAGTPASLMKLVTGLAALDALGPDHVFRTSVVQGKAPRDIVLVGGGDPFLAAKPGSGWPERADLTTLANLVAVDLIAAGQTKVRLSYDDSLFSGPQLNPRWPETYFPEGVVAPISALWVEQGDNLAGWGHVNDPAFTAAEFFASRLREAGLRVTGMARSASAPRGAEEIAGVDSAPVWQIVEQVIAVSDNEGAEVLAHQVGVAEGTGGSFRGGVAGVRAVLDRLAVPLEDAKIFDGSGLSRDNELPAATLLGVLAEAAQQPRLRAVVDGLPVAGFNGSLYSRLAESDREGLGRVRAKTGTLTGVHGLAGTVLDVDGTVLTFVVFADQVDPVDTLAARAALDDFTAALAACSCSATR